MVKIQANILPASQLIAYRFFLSFICLFCLLKVLGKLQKITFKEHAFCLCLGATLFAFNYYTFYLASLYITSGLLAVIFSLSPIINSINGYLWFAKPPGIFTLIGSVLGLIGTVLLFLPELQFGQHNHLWWGIILCVMGTCIFSTGNMISLKVNINSSYLPTTTCWAMFYGSLIMLVFSFISGWTITLHTIPLTDVFILSLLYLVLFASVICFLSYLELVRRIGADKAAYTTIIAPLIAIVISIILENYPWSIETLIAFGLIGVGNSLIFKKKLKKKLA